MSEPETLFDLIRSFDSHNTRRLRLVLHRIREYLLVELAPRTPVSSLRTPRLSSELQIILNRLYFEDLIYSYNVSLSRDSQTGTISFQLSPSSYMIKISLADLLKDIDNVTR